MIVFTCPGCGKGLKAADDRAGRRARCPHCRQTVRVAAGGAKRRQPAAVPGASGGAFRIAAGTDVPAGLLDGGRDEGAIGSDGGPSTCALAGIEPGEFLAPPQAPDEIGRLGAYRVLKVLGAGGMGVVFLAEDLQLRRRVALKVMPPVLAVSETARKRFLREAQAAAAIEHEHIVAIHQVSEDRGLPYLAMQFLPGESLQDRLDREGSLSIADLVRIGREAAQGLAAAHSRGLIHRDIKPANIWLESSGQRSAVSGQPSAVTEAKQEPVSLPTPDPCPLTPFRVKILDFGLARAVGDDTQVTRAGTIIGTPAYMAPEQARGQALDARCDLFSLGCVLYRAATGRQPFHGADVISTLLSVTSDQPEPPGEVRPDVPPDLSELVMRLLAKDRENRPPSAQAVVEALAAIEAGEVPEPEVLVRVPQRWKPARKRSRWVLAAGVVASLVVAVCLFAGGAFTNKKRSGAPAAEAKSARVEPAAGSRPSATAPSPAATAPTADPERRVAEWVLRLGGKVEVVPAGGTALVEAAAPPQLPSGVFGVRRVNFGGNRRITDADLETLKGLSHLESLWLSETGITDAGLAHLQGLRSLQGLNLGQTPISDRGLEHLRGLAGLQFLYLSGTGVTDAGLGVLKSFPALRELHLRWTGISDAGIAHLAASQELQVLWLQETRVGDAGLEHLRNLASLRELHLEGTRVSEAGVRRLKESLRGCAIRK